VIIPLTRISTLSEHTRRRKLVNRGFTPRRLRLPDIELADANLSGGGEPGHRPANFVSGYEHLAVRFPVRATAPL
jgi:hypothetical protein